MSVSPAVRRPTPAWQKMRPIVEKDAATVVKFHRNALFHTGIPLLADRAAEHCESVWQDFFITGSDRNARAFKIEENGIMVGFIHYSPVKPPGEFPPGTQCAKIHQIYVLSDRRNRGYGKTLFNYAYRQIEEQGHDVLLINTPNNCPSADIFFDLRHAIPVRRDTPTSLAAINLNAPEDGLGEFMAAHAANQAAAG
ncbi:MAG TPA: hypothetical protein DHV36_21550 [Desulfobacteraceae bacterium]|nr:hypothetical protein [Desulfobacteraceae bacterium]|tara:strand:- start:936 stop:1523 length:588 start_codon:yes stop_codon:yes gene_type:complete